MIDCYVEDDGTLDDVDVFIQPRPHVYTGPKFGETTVLYPGALVTKEQKRLVKELKEKKGAN